MRPIPKAKGFISVTKYKDKRTYYIQKFPLRYKRDNSIEYYKGSGFNSKESAKACRDELIKRRANGEFNTATDSFYNHCIKCIQERPISKYTKDKYIRACNNHIKPYFNDISIYDINVKTIQKNVSKWHVDLCTLYKIMSMACNDLYKQGIAEINFWHIVDKPKRKHRETKRPLTREQLQRYLQAIRDMKLEHVARLMFFTGLRKGEALGLQWKDVVITGNDSGYVNVRQSYSNAISGYELRQPKTPSSVRTAYFKDKRLVELLENKRKSDEEFVASYKGHKIISPSHFSKVYFDDIGKQLGFKLSSHYARVTYTSYALESGLLDTTLQHQLGHTSTHLIHTVYGKAVGDLQEKLQVDIYQNTSRKTTKNNKIIYHNFRVAKSH